MNEPSDVDELAGAACLQTAQLVHSALRLKFIYYFYFKFILF